MARSLIAEPLGQRRRTIISLARSIYNQPLRDAWLVTCPPREAVTDSSFDELGAVRSRALATVSDDIAAAIRAEAAGRS